MEPIINKIIGGKYDGRIMINYRPLITRHIIIATPKLKSVVGVWIITDKNNRPMTDKHILCDSLEPYSMAKVKVFSKHFPHLNKNIKDIILNPEKYKK